MYNVGTYIADLAEMLNGDRLNPGLTHLLLFIPFGSHGISKNRNSSERRGYNVIIVALKYIII